MTLSTIRTMVTSFAAYDQDLYLGTSPSAADLTTLVNWAIREFSAYTFCNYDPKITLTLTADTATYDITKTTATAIVSKQVLKVRRVTINGAILRSADGEYGLWTLPELEAFRPTYQTDESAVPRRAIELPGHKLYLHPAPTAAVVSDGDNYISGWYLPVDLVNSTDDANAPDIPLEFHECIAYLAAYKGAVPNASGPDGFNRVSAFNQEWRMKAEELRRRNLNEFIKGDRGSRSEWSSDRVFL